MCAAIVHYLYVEGILLSSLLALRAGSCGEIKHLEEVSMVDHRELGEVTLLGSGVCYYLHSLTLTR